MVLLERPAQQVDRGTGRPLRRGLTAGRPQVGDGVRIAAGLRGQPVQCHLCGRRSALSQMTRRQPMQALDVGLRHRRHDRRADQRMDVAQVARLEDLGVGEATERGAQHRRLQRADRNEILAVSSLAEDGGGACHRRGVVAQAREASHDRGRDASRRQLGQLRAPRARPVRPSNAASRARTDTSSGLPPVARHAASANCSLGTAFRPSAITAATATRLSGASAMRRAAGAASSAASSSAWAAGSSERTVAAIRTGRSATRRARNSSIRSDALSAQCRSSTWSTTGRSSARFAISQ